MSSGKRSVRSALQNASSLSKEYTQKHHEVQRLHALVTAMKRRMDRQHHQLQEIYALPEKYNIMSHSEQHKLRLEQDQIMHDIAQIEQQMKTDTDTETYQDNKTGDVTAYDNARQDRSQQEARLLTV